MEKLAISWRQDNGKMAESFQSHVIGVWQYRSIYDNRDTYLRIEC